MRNTLGFMLLGATLLLACDDHASQTRTTSASEDLKQAGKDLGAATQKAAEKVKDEAKREAKDLDVHLSTSTSTSTRDAGR